MNYFWQLPRNINFVIYFVYNPSFQSPPVTNPNEWTQQVIRQLPKLMSQPRSSSKSSPLRCKLQWQNFNYFFINRADIFSLIFHVFQNLVAGLYFFSNLRKACEANTHFNILFNGARGLNKFCIEKLILDEWFMTKLNES